MKNGNHQRVFHNSCNRRKKEVTIKINFSNRWLYTFILLGILVIISIGVYAYGTSTPSTFGHSAGELDFSQAVTGDITTTGKISAKELRVGASGISINDTETDLKHSKLRVQLGGDTGDTETDFAIKGIGAYPARCYGCVGSGGLYGQGATGVEGKGSNYDFYASGSGTNYGTSSSIRWKNNITEIDNALDKVLNLKGVYFNWKNYNESHGMGFIAEDVGKVVPEVVQYETDIMNLSNYYIDSEGNKKLYATGVDYGALTPVIVEAIKEQQKQIDYLKKELCSKDKSYSWCE